MYGSEIKGLFLNYTTLKVYKSNQGKPAFLSLFISSINCKVYKIKINK